MQVTINPQKELENIALSFLESDRQNPELGMGMFVETALRYALIHCIQKFGNSFQDNVNIDTAIENVRTEWKNRHY